MRPSFAATLAITVLTLIAGGCGGKDAKTTLAKPALAKRANAICTNYKARIEAIPQPAGQSGAQSALAYYQQTRPVLDDTVDQLAKLKPDDSLKADWTTYVNSQRTGAQLLDDLVRQVESGNKNVDGLKTQIAKTTTAGDAAAKRIGASSCVAASAAPS